ncbi:MAG: hypothetical protein LBV67_09750 [Streptococcaceae bacterium]|jgi:hypothetical protein|nr:hypothetical protein [Streptococcaceae bacterium]
MAIKNIFRMELFKNINDKLYLMMIGVLTVLGAISTGLIMQTIHSRGDNEFLIVLTVILSIFSGLGIGIFLVLYPFHLLNVDYKNKVMSLMFASGVSRNAYYLVKILATILCNVLVGIVMLFIPFVTLIVVNKEMVLEIMRSFMNNITDFNFYGLAINGILGIISSTVMLTTAVILTRGKMSGIFLYIGFSMIVSIITSFVTLILVFAISGANSSPNGILQPLQLILSLVQIAAFTFLGLQALKKQDL